MKKIMSLLCFVVAVASVSAQHNETLAMNTAGFQTEKNVENVSENVSTTTTFKYVLDSYGITAKKDVVFAEDHFLGKEISDKWNMFMQNYKRVYEQSVGFSDSSVEIVKPVIFNAVNKINAYYKKMLKSASLSKTDMINGMGHVLDCANLLCYENDTRNIETDIKNAKSPEQMLQVFASIHINYHQ